jgi:hypothetical protein
MLRCTQTIEKTGLLILILIICCLLGCRSNKEVPACITIEAGKAMKNDLIPAIEIESVIKPETNDTILIGSITRLEFYSGRYFVFDRVCSKSLYIFNSDGRLHAKTKHGNGPGEIIAPWDFFIDKERSRIIIWDQSTFKMMTFDMNLKYISDELHASLAIRNFKLINKDTAFVFAQGPVVEEFNNNWNAVSYNYLMYSGNFGKVFKKISPTPRELIQLTLNSPIYSDSSGIVFVAPLDNHIYKLADNNVIPEYYLEFGKYACSDEEIANGPSSFFPMVSAGQRVSSLDYVFENDQYLVVSFCFIDNWAFIIYSKQNNKTYYSNNMFKNNIMPKCVLQGLAGDSFIATVDPEDFINYSNSGKTVDERVSTTGLSDNPYLIVFSIGN